MDREARERLAKVLQDKMEEMNISQHQLAMLLEVGYHSVNSWVHARTTPTHENMTKIAKFLNTDLNSLNQFVAQGSELLPQVYKPTRAEDVFLIAVNLSAYEQARLLKMLSEKNVEAWEIITNS